MRGVRFDGADLHVIQISNLTGLVADNREGQLAARNLVNVLDPSSVALNCVSRQANQLDSALLEFRLEFGKGSELGGADGSVILWVGEEHNPIVTNEFMEVNIAVCSLGLEIWR